MSTRRPLRLGLNARIAAIAGIVTFAVLAGTGTSYALWSATAQVSSTATAATVSLTQTLEPSGSLGVTYTSAVLATSGPVTVKNTGTRTSAYSVALTGASTTAGMPGAISITMGTVATAAACTTSATLGSPVTGVFGATAVNYTGSLAVGASVIICVKTAITAANVTTYAGKSMTGSVTSTVTAVTAAGTASTWSASSAATTFVQAVAAPTNVTVDNDAWYWIYNTQNPVACVETQYFNNASGTRVWQEACGGEAQYQSNANELWKFIPTSGNYVRLLSKSVPSMWWSVPSAVSGADLQITSNAETTAEWLPIDAGGGTVAFSLRANPALCLTNGGTAALQTFLSIAPCATTTTAQRFVIDMLEIVQAPPTALSCVADGGGYNVNMSWPQLAGYQGVTTYRVLFDGVVLNASKYGGATGWYTTLQLQSSTMTAAAYGVGNHSVAVEQSVSSGAWTAVGSSHLLISASTPFLQCGT